VDQKSTSELMFYLEVFQGFLTQQETKLCGLECTRDRSICEAMWLHKLSTDLLDHEMDPMMTTKSRVIPVFPDGSKHDKMKYLHIRDMIQKKDGMLAVPSYT
jgi:hypothetical protein